MFYYCTVEGEYITGCAESIAGVPPDDIQLTQEQYQIANTGLMDSSKLVKINLQTMEITVIDRPPTPQEIATAERISLRDAFKSQIDGDSAASTLLNAQPSQIASWVDANINTIADVRWAFKVILKLLIYCLKKQP